MTLEEIKALPDPIDRLCEWPHAPDDQVVHQSELGTITVGDLRRLRAKSKLGTYEQAYDSDRFHVEIHYQDGREDWGHDNLLGAIGQFAERFKHGQHFKKMISASIYDQGLPVLHYDDAGVPLWKDVAGG
jgi:hypothetical protein